MAISLTSSGLSLTGTGIWYQTTSASSSVPVGGWVRSIGGYVPNYGTWHATMYSTHSSYYPHIAANIAGNGYNQGHYYLVLQRVG